MYLQCCKKLRLRFDRGWTARGGMYVTSLNQIPDDAHWQRRMFRFEKADIERLMMGLIINWPAAGHFSGAQRHHCSCFESLVATMRKLSQPINLNDLCAFFGRTESRLSEMTNLLAIHLMRIGMRSYFGRHRKKTRCRMRSAIDEETGPSLGS